MGGAESAAETGIDGNALKFKSDTMLGKPYFKGWEARKGTAGHAVGDIVTVDSVYPCIAVESVQKRRNCCLRIVKAVFYLSLGSCKYLGYLAAYGSCIFVQSRRETASLGKAAELTANLQHK